MPLPNESCCFWCGWGSSVVIVDMENRVSFSSVMNEMREGTTGDTRGIGPLFALYTALLG